LLEPLVAGRAAFVSAPAWRRNVWKMRQFTGQFGLSLFVNLGPLVLCHAHMSCFCSGCRDPFTMFKVFRRDCLYALEFECNRFDLILSWLVKLSAGVSPDECGELSFAVHSKEGKKVQIVPDPLTGCELWHGSICEN